MKELKTTGKYYFLINSLEGGWAERVTINSANDFLKQWKDVYIITLKSTNFYELPKWVHHIALSKIKNNLLMFLLIPWYVLKFKKIYIKLHLSDWISLLEIANFVHILAKKQATISFRTHISFFIGILGSIQKTILTYLYPKAGKIVVNSMENKYDLAEYLNISEDRIEVKYNPIDTEKIEKLKNEDIPEEIKIKLKTKWKKVFITTWRLIWQKHHEKIIDALKDIYANWETNRIYLIIWNGPRRGKLETHVENIGLDKNIFFLWEQANVFKYLIIADIFLYASEVEGFPNVLLEARELWLPIITSDFKSGAKEVILWEYRKDTWKEIQYPYRGKYGTLLDSKEYKKQFLEVYNTIWN